MTKTERWLNLIAFLLDHRYAVTREEILSQVADYTDDWSSDDATRRESTRRKFERDKRELRELGVVLETQKVMPDHEDQEVEAYLLKPKDFYLHVSVDQGGKSAGAGRAPLLLAGHRDRARRAAHPARGRRARCPARRHAARHRGAVGAA